MSLFRNNPHESAGYRPLREAIAMHLRISRAVRCDAEQIVIVSGSQQGLYLAAHMLLDPGDEVWFENPGYLGARIAFLSAGATLIPVPVEGDGLNVDEGHEQAPAARCVYTTPSHQFPLGHTMSLKTRLKLLDSRVPLGGSIALEPIRLRDAPDWLVAAGKRRPNCTTNGRPAWH